MTTSSVSSRQNSAAVENDEIDLGRLLGYLIDGRWWIVCITGFFMMMGVAYALLATPVFKANALLQVEKKASGTALLGDMADVLGGEQADAAAEIELLTSRMVLGRTVQELHLDTVVTPDFFPLVGRGVSRLMGQPYPRMAISRFEVASELIGTSFTLILTGENRFTLEVKGRVLEGQVGKLLQNEDVTLLLSDVAAYEGQVFTLAKKPVLDVIAELQSGLQVSEKGKNTGIISLALEGEDKGRIRAVLDNISQNYLQQNVLRKTEEAQKSLDFLQTHLPQVKDDLNRSEELLNTYRQQNESVDLSLEAKAALDTMVGIEKQLNELTFREAELQQLYTRQHPAYIALMEKRQTLINTKNNINKSIKRLPKTQQDILRLTRDVQVGQEIFVQLLNKQQELNIMKAGTIGNVRIIDDAAVETRAVKPKKPLIVVLATLLGGMLSVGLILVRAAFHRGVESPEQLEEMGLSVYATIPYSEDQAKIEQQKKKGRKAMALNEALLAARNPADLAMESLRSLRTSLHFAMMEAKNNIVMISGPGPGLGIDQLCCHLGHGGQEGTGHRCGLAQGLYAESHGARDGGWLERLSGGSKRDDAGDQQD
jgi:tyrosine-protein kinase Etk/Wzc